MPLKGGRPALVAVEVLESRDPQHRVVHDFVVRHVERVTPFGVDAARDRVAHFVDVMADQRPCVIIDVGSPQGLALHQACRGMWSRDLHRAHAFPGTGPRGPLFSAFLQAYSTGRVTFAPGLDFRADLDRALVFFGGSGVKSDGVDLSSEDEALVIALGLAMSWPRHGAPAARSDTA